MRISELIKKLEKVKEVHGDLDVLMECSDDASVNSVCYVNGECCDPNQTHMSYTDLSHIRLTDDPDSIYEIYGEDPDDTEMIVEEF